MTLNEISKAYDWNYHTVCYYNQNFNDYVEYMSLLSFARCIVLDKHRSNDEVIEFSIFKAPEPGAESSSHDGELVATEKHTFAEFKKFLYLPLDEPKKKVKRPRAKKELQVVLRTA